MHIVDAIPHLIKAEYLAVLAAAVMGLWVCAARRGGSTIGPLTRWDALIIASAALVWASFEILIIYSTDTRLAVALSRIMRLWGYSTWLYLGWRQLRDGS